jgi:outer membrane lipoprotein-sorting protein
MTLEARNGPTMEAFLRASYWRSGLSVRIHEEHLLDKHIEEILVKNGEGVSIGMSSAPGARPAHRVATRFSAADLHSMGDVWRNMLLSFPGRGLTSNIELGELLTMPSKRLQLKSIREGEKAFIRLERTYDDPVLGSECRMEIWFDPEVNYLARKKTTSSEKYGQSSRGVAEIDEFLEVSPGVFFPTKCTTTSYRNGEYFQTMVATLERVRVNEPISSRIFNLTIPAGTLLDDHIEGKRYVVNNDGKPSGRKQNIDNFTIHLPSQAELPLRSQSPSAEPSRTSWFVWGSLCLLFFTVIGWVIRRRNNFARDSE